MSIVFKRPMFRGGGNVGGGIMTGIRENYSDGSARERLMKVMEEYPTGGVSPASQYLISTGLDLISRPTSGNVLADVATSGQQNLNNLFQGLGAEQKLKRELALAGEKLDIEQEQALEVARQKALGEAGYQKEYSPERKRYELYSTYTDPNKKGFTTTVEQDYPGAMADYGSYIEQAVRQRGEDVIGVLPYKKSGKTYDWNFNEMIPGAKYFKPDTKKLYERNPENNILIEYDPYTGKKLAEYKIEG